MTRYRDCCKKAVADYARRWHEKYGHETVVGEDNLEAAEKTANWAIASGDYSIVEICHGGVIDPDTKTYLTKGWSVRLISFDTSAAPTGGEAPR